MTWNSVLWLKTLNCLIRLRVSGSSVQRQSSLSAWVSLTPLLWCCSNRWWQKRSSASWSTTVCSLPSSKVVPLVEFLVQMNTQVFIFFHFYFISETTCKENLDLQIYHANIRINDKRNCYMDYLVLMSENKYEEVKLI